MIISLKLVRCEKEIWRQNVEFKNKNIFLNFSFIIMGGGGGPLLLQIEIEIKNAIIHFWAWSCVQLNH